MPITQAEAHDIKNKIAGTNDAAMIKMQIYAWLEKHSLHEGICYYKKYETGIVSAKESFISGCGIRFHIDDSAMPTLCPGCRKQIEVVE